MADILNVAHEAVQMLDASAASGMNFDAMRKHFWFVTGRGEVCRGPVDKVTIALSLLCRG